MNRRHPGIPLPSDTMSPEERAEAKAHLAECPECAERMEGLSAVFAEADQAAETVTPSPSLRDRLLESIASAPRLGAYAEESARLLDVALARARDYLWRIDDPTRWHPTPFPGVEALWVRGGPNTADAITGFVRVKAGTAFPMHDHLGPEQGLLLQGRIKDQTGRVYRPGDQLDMETGSQHELEALPIVDAVFLAVAHGGLKFGEIEFRAGEMV